MKTSDLHLRLYPEPSPPSNRSRTSVMQTLLSMHESLLTAIYAPNAYCCNASVQTSASWLDPYLHRIYWHLTSPENGFIAGLEGGELQWAKKADAVPHQLRFATYERAKRTRFELLELLLLQNAAIAVQPIDYFAHRSTPHLWCALND